MTLADAIRDARATVALFQRQPRLKRNLVRRQMARDLGVRAYWGSIERAMVRRLLAEDAVPMRWAA